MNGNDIQKAERIAEKSINSDITRKQYRAICRRKTNIRESKILEIYMRREHLKNELKD
jgi:hypothetical protein